MSHQNDDAADLPQGRNHPETESLPDEYATDGLDVIPCSPGLLFVSWELGGAVGRRLRERAGSQIDWVLRVINPGAGTENEIQVDARDRKHYLHVEPGQRYRIELGVSGPGGYHAVTEGIEVKMPPAKPADDENPQWVNFRSERPSEAPEHPPREPGRRPPADAQNTGLQWEPGLINGASSSSIRPAPGDQTGEEDD
jgi:hypothetical protein